MVFFFSFLGKINVGIATTTNGDIKIQMTWSASLASAKNYHTMLWFLEYLGTTLYKKSIVQYFLAKKPGLDKSHFKIVDDYLITKNSVD